MADVLVIYGTTHGHTAKVARALADALRAHGQTVDVVDAARVRVAPDRYGGVVVAASLHAGRYQKPVRKWLQQHADALRGKPTAFVSVCLAVLQKTPAVDDELAAALYGFFRSADWQPTLTLTVAGALPYTRYNRLTRWMMRRMVARAGGDVDTTRDYEYTNWDDVRAFAARFLQLLEPDAVRRAVTRVAAV